MEGGEGAEEEQRTRVAIAPLSLRREEEGEEEQRTRAASAPLCMSPGGAVCRTLE